MSSARQSLLALLVTAGLACATSAQTPAAAAASHASRGDCFYRGNIDNFTAVDNRTVNLRVGVRDVYQLKLFAPCPDIDFRQSLGLRTQASPWICAGSGLDVDVITRSPIGRQRCPVTAVRHLTPEEVAALPPKQRP